MSCPTPQQDIQQLAGLDPSSEGFALAACRLALTRQRSRGAVSCFYDRVVIKDKRKPPTGQQPKQVWVVKTRELADLLRTHNHDREADNLLEKRRNWTKHPEHSVGATEECIEVCTQEPEHCQRRGSKHRARSPQQMHTTATKR